MRNSTVGINGFSFRHKLIEQTQMNHNSSDGNSVSLMWTKRNKLLFYDDADNELLCVARIEKYNKKDRCETNYQSR